MLELHHFPGNASLGTPERAYFCKRPVWMTNTRQAALMAWHDSARVLARPVVARVFEREGLVAPGV